MHKAFTQMLNSFIIFLKGDKTLSGLSEDMFVDIDL
jgi:hypothetical protein